MAVSWIRGIAVVLLLGLMACSPGRNAQGQTAPQRVGMANPASEHCVKKGGKLEIRKNAEGAEYGICHLPDGTEVDEWELFRRDGPTG